MTDTSWVPDSPTARPVRQLRVAVTGASGFVGRHVVRELESRGVRPILVRRPGSREPVESSAHRVVDLDVATAAAGAYERLGKPELLIHLAWDGLPNYRSARHLDHELPAQRAFLAALLADGLPALTVTGTCFEYGLRSGQLSEDLPDGPVTAYGRAKSALRHELDAMHQARAFAFTWARLFYLHGEGQATGSLLPQLEAAIARGDSSFRMSGGAQLRDYLAVETAAAHLVTLGLSGLDNGVVNICSGQPISVLALVRRARAALGSAIELELGAYPYPEYEPMSFWGDRGKLDACLRRAAAVCAAVS